MRLLLAAVAIGGAHAQTSTSKTSPASGRDYVRICVLAENAHPCLQAIYTSTAVNRLPDAIKNQKTCCLPGPNGFPPDDIVSRVSAWLRAHPAASETTSEEALSAALRAMYASVPTYRSTR
jgi:hypothetical protein